MAKPLALAQGKVNTDQNPTSDAAANRPECRSTFRYRAWLVKLLKLTAGAAIVAWLVGSGRLDLTVVSRALSNWPQLLLLLAILYAAVGITSWRWRILLRAQRISVGLGECFSVSMIGLVLGLGTPAGAGGDVARIYFVQRHADRKMGAVISTVVLDRLLGLLSLLLLGGIALVMNRGLVLESPALLRLGSVVGVAIVAGFAFLVGAICLSAPASMRLQRLAARVPILRPIVPFADAVAAYRDAPLAIVAALLLSLLSQAAICASFALILHVMGSRAMSVSALFTTVPAALIATVMPLTPASIGVGQIAFFTLFQLTSGRGIDGANAFTLYQCVYLVMSLTGLVFYLRSKAPVSRSLEAEASSP
jgi:uncharacterized protein (TIRG00374 family)